MSWFTPTTTTQASLPVVTLKDGIAITSSRAVADYFEKQHAHVLRKIDGLDCSPVFRASNFGLTNESRLTGSAVRDLRSFDMTKDGFVFLAMGFTGSKAAAFKEAYIAKFNEMATELASRQEAELKVLREKREWMTVDEYRADRGERWPRFVSAALG